VYTPFSTCSTCGRRDDDGIIDPFVFINEKMRSNPRRILLLNFYFTICTAATFKIFNYFTDSEAFKRGLAPN